MFLSALFRRHGAILTKCATQALLGKKWGLTEATMEGGSRVETGVDEEAPGVIVVVLPMMGTVLVAGTQPYRSTVPAAAPSAPPAAPAELAVAER